MQLKAEHLLKIYGKRTVVKDVSINVSQGEIVGLLGPNGAGKTTSFYMIVGLIKPNGGTIYLDDTDITKQAMYKRAQLGVGYLPQEASVFRQLSVEDNILSVMQVRGFSKEYQKEKLESLISEFGLGHIRKSLGIQLSGGERRRTEIARALAVDPKFILLDEPFAGVDPIAVEDIQGIVATLKNKNIGILITDHNVDETLAITDRAYLLYDGRILQAGTPEDLAADPEVRRVYLGKNFELRRPNRNAQETTDTEKNSKSEPETNNTTENDNNTDTENTSENNIQNGTQP
ncbi:MAG: LPS export ABC transporter ATP-binding protein [Bacteroidales bacterium]|nr:LPS export ABC transporter ATP-binding protein [Bacteroidales bacterium]MBR4328014.1 LPS export ABC transporter ATP-binding protein [Bacteroidales bacterium]